MNIHIPTPLRAYTGGKQTVNVAGATVSEALQQLTSAYPELQQHLYTGEGKLRSFVNIYLNDDDIRYLPQKEATPMSEDDELTIIPSIAGGCSLARGLQATSNL
ncbi:MAG TPA: ubiquitin-like small modifier protein 1 [Acidobacteriaceae bacterium]|nr:ubiquitin-like small modifier protein 1 [Acidobacteriaceae bacterium]